MTYEQYQRILMIKRKLRAMWEAGRIHDYVVSADMEYMKTPIQLAIQYKMGHPWVWYTLEEFLKHLKKGHIDSLADNLSGPNIPHVNKIHKPRRQDHNRRRRGNRKVCLAV